MKTENTLNELLLYIDSSLGGRVNVFEDANYLVSAVELNLSCSL